MADFFLIVTEPFGRFRRGDQVLDEDIEAVTATHPDKVVRVNVAATSSPPPRRGDASEK